MEVIEKRHRNCEVIPYMYSVMIPPRTWESSSALEDYGSELASAAIIYRPLRQRVYSILLSGAASRFPGTEREQLSKIQVSVYPRETYFVLPVLGPPTRSKKKRFNLLPGGRSFLTFVFVLANCPYVYLFGLGPIQKSISNLELWTERL